MKKIAIVTDGSCDIPKKLIEEYSIHVIPFQVIFGEEVYKTYGDWGTITKEEFYVKLQTSVEPPTSAIPPNIDFVKTFQKALAESDTVICIVLSKNFSGLYQNALRISSTFKGDDITIVDSRVATSTLGVLVIEAAKMAKNGATKEEILKRLDELIPQARLVVVLNSVDAVYRSGRVGWAKKFLVSSLRIKPVVYFNDGSIVSGGTLIGRKEVVKRLKFIAPIILEKAITDIIFIWHVRNPGTAQELLELMETHNTQNKRIIVQEAGSLVGTHVGEKAIGFMYIGEYNKKWLLKMKV